MDEVDEVAQAIYEQRPEFFPLTREQAVAVAWSELGNGSMVLIDNLADSLMQIKPRQLSSAVTA
mgnify:CR=1 FL=1